VLSTFFFSSNTFFEVMEDITEDKALGPDGFPMAFIQSCWDLFRKEVRGHGSLSCVSSA
jgi:hypothetical protein